jgi:sugar phosphate isomerase/epimerase
MKLAFWMLGMPDWSNEEIARRAADNGYQGAALRCQQRDWSRPASGPFNIAVDSSDQEIAGTRQAFADAGVEMSTLLCYNTSPCSGGQPAWDHFEHEMARHAELAAKLGAPSIRFQVEGLPVGVTWTDYLANIWRAVGRALDTVPGVTAVAENHVGRASAEQLLVAAQAIGDERIGVEYSPDHCLVMQEDILGLIDRYAPFIHGICWADRKIVPQELGRFDGRYYHVRYESCPVGEGDIPAAAILDQLAAHGYDSWISLKWEKSNWFGHHLPDSETALAQFPGYMRQFGHF